MESAGPYLGLRERGVKLRPDRYPIVGYSELGWWLEASRKTSKERTYPLQNSGTDFSDLMVILKIIVVFIPTSKVLIGRIFRIF